MIDAVDALFERAGSDWPAKAAAMGATVVREIERHFELSPEQIERVREAASTYLAENMEKEIKSFVRDAFAASAAKLFLESLSRGVQAVRHARNWDKLRVDFRKQLREFVLSLAKNRTPKQRGRPPAWSSVEEFFRRVHFAVKLRNLQEERKRRGLPSALAECLAEVAEECGMSVSALDHLLWPREPRAKRTSKRA